MAARCADSKKADDVVLLDLRKSPYGLTDYLLIMSATSNVHLRSLSDYVEDILEQEGLYVVHKDGKRSEHWTVLDFGGFIVHIFHEDVRREYSLERLWEDAKTVRWEARKSGKAKTKKRRKRA